MASLTGFTKKCATSTGGNKLLYIIAVPDLTSFTLDITETEKWASYALEGAADFEKYEFLRDSMEVKEETTFDPTNNTRITTQSIEFAIAKLDENQRKAVEEIIDCSACGLVVVAQDNEGVWRVFGYSVKQGAERPLQLSTANSTTGKLLSDSATNVVTLVTETNELAREFIGTVPTP